VREAFYHFLLDQPLEADARLMLAFRRQVAGANDTSAQLLRGILHLSYGATDEAERAFQRIVQRGAPDSTSDRAWFYLARIAHRRGQAAQVLAALTRIGSSLSGELDAERRVLHAYALIEGGKPADAIALLEKLSPSSAWAAYGRFNLGVALVRSGDASRGLALLDEFGKSSVSGDELMVLRDKANLAVAYTRLQRGDSQGARDALSRARLDGMVSNKALLGMGWALSAQQQHERALVYWDELARRDSLHVEVQEAMLAVPYALLQLDARKQALARYQQADTAYVAEQARLDRAIESVRSGAFVDALLRAGAGDSADWLQRLHAMPEGPATRYLGPLLATNEFQSAFDDLRSLIALRDRAVQWSRKLRDLENAPNSTARKSDDPTGRMDTLRTRLGRFSSESDAVLSTQRRRIEQLAASELETRKRVLDDFRAQARLAIAEIYDRATSDRREQGGAARQ
jgi:tetratricopeptide (TPR) repeat protein